MVTSTMLSSLTRITPSTNLMSSYRFSTTAGGSGIEPGICTTSFLLPPSNLLFADLYGPMLSLVTNVRPVSVSGGNTNVPDSQYMYRYTTERNPCRYGDWSMVKSSAPEATPSMLPASRSNPPPCTLPDRPRSVISLAHASVLPAST